MIRAIVIACVCGLLYLMFGSHLFLGWMTFPARNLPRMTFDVPTLAFAGSMLGVFVFLLRHTLRWWGLSNSWDDESLQRRASLANAARWTGLILVLFVSGTSLVAIGHQMIWLSSGSKNAKPYPPLSFFGQLSFSARRSDDSNTLKNVGLAILSEASASGTLVPGGTHTPDGRPLHSWITMLGGNLMIDTTNVDFGVPWNEPPNDRLFRCGIADVWINDVMPRFDSQGFGLSHISLNGRLCPTAIRTADKHLHPPRTELLRDGAGNTLLAGEAAGDFQPWGSPHNVRDPLLGLGMSSQGFGTATSATGTLFVMADGSVRSISNDIDPAVFKSLGTPSPTAGTRFDERER